MWFKSRLNSRPGPVRRSRLSVGPPSSTVVMAHRSIPLPPSPVRPTAPRCLRPPVSRHCRLSAVHRSAGTPLSLSLCPTALAYCVAPPRRPPPTSTCRFKMVAITTVPPLSPPLPLPFSRPHELIDSPLLPRLLAQLPAPERAATGSIFAVPALAPPAPGERRLGRRSPLPRWTLTLFSLSGCCRVPLPPL
jgi:hypothetical protein